MPVYKEVDRIRIVSVDPGLEKVAYAIWDFQTGLLIEAGLVQCKHEAGIERAQKWQNMAEKTAAIVKCLWAVDVSLVIEIPQVYTDRKTDPNDLIDLAGVVGALTFNKVKWSPTPREWKGQLPKEISKQRVDQKLSDGEKSRIKWPIKSLCHNVYDAIHLGLTYLEREGLREI